MEPPGKEIIKDVRLKNRRIDHINRKEHLKTIKEELEEKKHNTDHDIDRLMT